MSIKSISMSRRLTRAGHSCTVAFLAEHRTDQLQALGESLTITVSALTMSAAVNSPSR